MVVAQNQAKGGPRDGGAFPLSPGEREQQDRGWRLADGRCANSGKGVTTRRRTILPLPGGEGLGEEEPNVVHPTVGSVTGMHPLSGVRPNGAAAPGRNNNPRATALRGSAVRE